jgi:type IV pilus assembly protein PilE
MRLKLPCPRHLGGRSGFTLIELMVTVAIIAILAAVAVPAYTDYVTRGKIPQATNNLAAMRVKMEQYFQDNREYPASCSAATVPKPDDDDFTYSCSGGGDAFTVTATGKGGMSGFTYTINQNNVKTTEAPSAWGDSSSCWVVKKGGGC